MQSSDLWERIRSGGDGRSRRTRWRSGPVLDGPGEIISGVRGQANLGSGSRLTSHRSPSKRLGRNLPIPPMSLEATYDFSTPDLLRVLNEKFSLECTWV